MGDYSRETFDKLKHYAGVRMQQGVPLIDADWNEMDEIRKEELRLFLEWYMGNGIARGNDGFAILNRSGSSNDFIIKGGSGGSPGCCLVKGRQVRIETDTPYTSQSLYGDAGLATKWGVAQLPPLTTPSGTRNDLVYLDVWEREVDSQEDAGLVNPAIGQETTVRIKRQWVVRVAEGAANLPAAPAGHDYYTLATLSRTSGQATIAASAITDKRRKNIEPMDNAFSDFVKVRANDIYLDKDVKSTGRYYDQTGIVMPPGGIIMWSGVVSNIPTGWALCDGSNGTPDLRNRFIVGAGNSYNPGNTGGSNNVTLSVAQMPSHDHPITSATAPTHGHSIISKFIKDLFGVKLLGESIHWGSGNVSIDIGNKGGSQSHENRPPYYALCYIMKK